jgi:hypothetical protein
MAALVNFVHYHVDELSGQPDRKENDDYKAAMWTCLALGAARLRTVKEEFRQGVARMHGLGGTDDPDERRKLDEFAGVLGLMSMAVVWGGNKPCFTYFSLSS